MDDVSRPTLNLFSFTSHEAIGGVGLDSPKIFFLILVSVAGMGYVYSGKKRSNNVLIVSGVLMMIFPYMITNTIAVVIISIVLIFGPFFIKR